MGFKLGEWLGDEKNAATIRRIALGLIVFNLAYAVLLPFLVVDHRDWVVTGLIVQRAFLLPLTSLALLAALLSMWQNKGQNTLPKKTLEKNAFTLIGQFIGLGASVLLLLAVMALTGELGNLKSAYLLLMIPLFALAWFLGPRIGEEYRKRGGKP